MFIECNVTPSFLQLTTFYQPDRNSAGDARLMTVVENGAGFLLAKLQIDVILPFNRQVAGTFRIWFEI